MKKEQSFWEKLNFKFRLALLNEQTLKTIWSAKISRMTLIVVLLALFFFCFALFATLTWFTPLRNYLPGNSKDIRYALIQENSKIDSLTNQLDLQSRYLEMIKNVVSGEITSDSVITLDSMAIIQKEELLLAKSQITEAFKTQYESKEKDHLLMFTAQPTAPTVTFFRPVQGIIIESFSQTEGRLGVSIQVPAKSNVMSIMSGTLISTYYDFNMGWSAIIQHDGDYISIYHNMDYLVKKIGTSVSAGEIIGVMGDHPFNLEIWQSRNLINPEDVIVF